ncbi:GGDEF domain-containing protein [Pseudomonas floridensis]|uniref:diguanylate cyclase n=2 Tax=Pseudomonas TaxID=286 RepID=A0A1X0MY29_9PSED|nr:GGDEF domain-containing protein [Pseudomonas floridensis]ORC53937.1 GGDEF domain-containing protein [Pseudomonas floridensis]
MNAQMQSRIKLLLSPAVALAQTLAFLCWIVVLVVTPGIQYGALEVSLTLGLLFTCLWQYHARRFGVWRLAGIAFVVVVALCFSRASQLNDQMGVNWALPVAVTIVLSATLLVVYTRDYLLVAIISWTILSPTHDVEPGSVAYIFMTLFFMASISLGVLLNHTYTRTLRNVLSLENKFRELSLTDYLTDILNRRALMEALERHLADRSAGYFLMLDIDNFKHINDGFGHDAGDEILRVMGACLKQTQGSLACGRLGGEEFGVVLPVCSASEARDYVSRLLGAIRQSAAGCAFTCSAGLADIDHTQSSSMVLKTADVNLYLAKGAGKDMAFWMGSPLAGSSSPRQSGESESARDLVDAPGAEP